MQPTGRASKIVDFSADIAARGTEYSWRALHRRAVEAAIWGLPIVSTAAMRKAYFRDAGATYNDICHLSRPADWSFQTTTANTGTYYVYFNYNTSVGPVVAEIPGAVGAGVFGTLVDAWQVPLADVGTEGKDKGWGGKYMICPPGYEDVPEGYFPVRPGTYNGYGLLRTYAESMSVEDHARALKLIRQVKVYPFSEAGKSPQQRQIDITGRMFDGIVRWDDTFYDHLAQMVEEEPAHERDLAALALLRSIGIEKDRPFHPGAATRAVLKEAAQEVHASLMHALTQTCPHWADSQWGQQGVFASRTRFTFIDHETETYGIDERALNFFHSFAPPNNLGAASFRVLTTQDAQGNDLQGSESYRLHIPPNVPVSQNWSLTVYDLETAAFVRESPRVAIDSRNPRLERNEDGSVEIWFSRVPPAGAEPNWLYTAAGKRWFAMFRFYGSQKPLFNRSWVLPDIENIDSER